MLIPSSAPQPMPTSVYRRPGAIIINEPTGNPNTIRDELTAVPNLGLVGHKSLQLLGPRDKGKGKVLEGEMETLLSANTTLTLINNPIQPDVLLDMQFSDSAGPSTGIIMETIVGDQTRSNPFLYESQTQEYVPFYPTQITTNTTSDSFLLDQTEEVSFISLEQRDHNLLLLPEFLQIPPTTEYENFIHNPPTPLSSPQNNTALPTDSSITFISSTL